MGKRLKELTIIPYSLALFVLFILSGTLVADIKPGHSWLINLFGLILLCLFGLMVWGYEKLLNWVYG